MERLGALEQKLRREAVSVFLNILTGMAILIQVFVSLQSDIAVPHGIFFSDIGGMLNSILNPMFVLTVIFFPILYCPILSLRLVPKRIISPLNIQLGTFAVNAVIILDLFLREYSQNLNPSNSGPLTGLFLLYAFAAGFYQGALGFFQTILVRWFVGLNIGDLVAQTYTVTTDFQTVKTILLRKTFRGHVWNFHTEADDEDTLVLRAKQMVLVLRKSENGTILSVVPYDEGLYAIEQSPVANDAVQSMLNDLRCRLPNSPELSKPQVTTFALDAVAGIARMYARKRGQSKVAATRDIWQGLPKYLRYAILSTLVAYAIIGSVYFLQHELNVTIDFGIYLELSGLFLLFFLGELGLAGWQEFRRRPRNEEESE